MKVSDLLGNLFLARDVAHSVHLSTRSYAAHKALGDFYDGIVDLADSLAEAYQGRKGLIGPIPLLSMKKPAGDIIEFLKDSLDDFEQNRYEVVDKTDTALQNIMDEIVALYLSTLYKLQYLK